MNKEQAARAREIFGDAIEAAPPDRPELLTRACGDDQELRARVESLLAAHERGKGFMEQPTVTASQTVAFDPANTAPFTEHTGTTIGPYTLGRVIGEGGFGTVFEAEQHHPLKRKVALKVIKAGMDTRAVIARFDAERAALALMDHPNIARVLDAGATTTGRPYFVMELVAGIPLTEYCDQKKLHMRQRLELFINVCHAVQHAHQKGIIHRDLKPSNVLVSEVDGKPLAKVIDFGIAKATQDESPQRSIFTQTGQMIGTPLYMSPEQAAGQTTDIDTRSDIYSLGVLLYELLTGTTPFDATAMRSAAFDEIVRIIREVEPPRPSARVSTLGAAVTTIAQQRSTESRRLSQSIKGDLDWIVMKCLEKERARRYESAGALAQDLRNYLGDQPVSAGPPSNIYRLKKFTRRNKGPVAAAVLVTLALIAGTIGTTLGMLRANEAKKAEADRADGEHRQKETAEKRLLQIQKGNDVLSSIFTRLDPRLEEKQGKSLRVQLGERLEQAAKDLQGEGIGEPLTVADLQMTLGNSQLGLGHANEAITLFTQARATYTQKLSPHDPKIFTSMDRLALAYLDAGKLDLALPLSQQALDLRQANLGNNHADTLASMSTLATAYQQAGKLDLALSLEEEVVKRMKAVLGPDDPQTLTSMNNLAAACQAAGKLNRAIDLYQQTLKRTQALEGEGHYDSLVIMMNLAVACTESGDLEKGLSLSQETLKLCKANLGEDHPLTLASINSLAGAYRATGNLDQAIPLFEKALKMTQAKFGPEHGFTLNAAHNLAEGYLALPKLEQAIPLLESTLAGMKAKLGPDHRDTLACMNTLASAYQAADDFNRALPLFEETLNLMMRKLGPDHFLTLSCMTNRAQAFQSAGNLEKAVSLYRQALQAQQKALGTGHPLTLNTMNNLGAALSLLKQYPESIKVLKETLKLETEKLGADHPGTLGCLKNLALTYQANDQPEAAIPLFEQLYKLQQAKLGADHPDTMETMEGLIESYQAAGKNLDKVPPLYEQVLKVQQTSLGPEHRETVKTMNNLAAAYWSAKRLDRSIPLFEQTLELSKKAFGLDDPDTLLTMANLGVNYRDGNRVKEGLALMQEAVDRAEKLPGPFPQKLEWVRNQLRTARSSPQPRVNPLGAH